MGLTDDNGMNTTMLVGPTSVPYGQSNGGFGNGFGSDGWWILLLFLLLGNGGFGNGFGGGFGGGAGELYPWMNQSNQIAGGFRDQMLNDSINNISNQLDAMQMTNMQNLFGVHSALQQCCCDNRAATADLKYTVATEACADRAAVGDALQSVLANMNAGIQSIKDQLCQDKIDAKNEEIANLRQQLNMASLAASQNAQTATIQAGQRALANEVEQYVLPTPRPAYVVQNPNCCQQFGGCGCGVA